MRKILSTMMGLLLSAAAAWSQAMVGSAAPNFTKTTLDNGQISLAQYRGKVVYLFFMGFN
jgi:peroxiredoxin